MGKKDVCQERYGQMFPTAYRNHLEKRYCFSQLPLYCRAKCTVLLCKYNKLIIEHDDDKMKAVIKRVNKHIILDNMFNFFLPLKPVASRAITGVSQEILV